MYITDICIDDIMNELVKNHKVSNKKTVKKAYDYALEMHEGQTRKSGEPYIMHPLRVARFIATWGFESDVICAALLHDVVEDCHTTIDEVRRLFGDSISRIVDAVTSLDKDLKNADGLTKEEIDKLSDAKLQERMTEKALFVKAADRLDNLYTIDVFKKEKQIKKAKHTREVLIPMLMKEEAFKIIDQLEDLCLKIEHSERYDNINKQYIALCKANSYTTGSVLKLFTDVFHTGSMYVPTELRSYLDYVARFKYNTRSSISVYRQLTADANNINQDLPKLLNKKNIAMYDLTLVINDEKNSLHGPDRPYELSPLDVFFKIFEAVLVNHNICILEHKATTYGESNYFILRDEMDNLYRLFIKTETQYMHYKLGHVIDSDDYTFDSDFSNTESTPKIKVFTKDGEAKYIDAGATMLDFAFMIHSELGFHFKYATIDNNKGQQADAYDRLSPGDQITIETDPEIQPKIQWFKYVKTERAIEHLIRKFSTETVH